MLGIEAPQAVGKQIRIVLSREGLDDLLRIIDEGLKDYQPQTSRQIEVECGDTRRKLSVNTSIIRDRRDEVFGLIINFRDVAELRKFHEQMNRTDRLATLGTFAAGLAHEIRNPLGAIKGVAQLLAEDVKSNPKALEYTQIIVKEVNRLDALVREVYEFSQPSETPARATNLNTLARDTLMLALRNPKSSPRPGVKVVEKYGELPDCHLSRDKITQALLNIVINAFQATPDEGTIALTTTFVDGTQLPLRIDIHNTGSSIPPEELGRIFEPFYTSKETGSGLGLSIAFQIISHHGGDVLVRNDNDGVGFTVRLPLHTSDEDITLLGTAG
jgi:signal transduction histidine kinase